MTVCVGIYRVVKRFITLVLGQIWITNGTIETKKANSCKGEKASPSILENPGNSDNCHTSVSLLFIREIADSEPNALFILDKTRCSYLIKRAVHT